MLIDYPLKQILILLRLLPSLKTMSAPESSKDLAGHSPQSRVDTTRWWRHPNLRALNLLMIIPLLSIFSQGYVCTVKNLNS